MRSHALLEFGKCCTFTNASTLGSLTGGHWDLPIKINRYCHKPLPPFNDISLFIVSGNTGDQKIPGHLGGWNRTNLGSSPPGHTVSSRIVCGTKWDPILKWPTGNGSLAKVPDARRGQGKSPCLQLAESKALSPGTLDKTSETCRTDGPGATCSWE